MATVILPPLRALAVDLVAALFKMNAGDVRRLDRPDVEAYEVDVEKFGLKLQRIYEKRGGVLNKVFGMLGWPLAKNYCGGTIQNLVEQTTKRPGSLLRDISRFEISSNETQHLTSFRWGSPPYVPASVSPPLFRGLEFMEGVRTWPATQFDASGKGKKAKYLAGLGRSVEIGCNVVGGIALGLIATAYSIERRGVATIARLLIPVSQVEFDINTVDVKSPVGATYEKLRKLDRCDLPETALKLAVYAIAPSRHAIYKYVELRHRGGPDMERDSHKEIVLEPVDLNLLRLMRRGRGAALIDIMAEWCQCKERGGEEECAPTKEIFNSLMELGVYLETGSALHLYTALSTALRAVRSKNKRIELVADLIKRFVSHAVA